MLFRFEREIKLPDNGIFLSVLPDERAYYRKDHQLIGLSRGRLTEDWELVTDSGWEKPGWEDPRVFHWNGRDYLANNLLDGVAICDLQTGQETPVGLKGKNFSFLPGDDLTFIRWFSPLEIHQLDAGTTRPLIKRRWPDFRMSLPDSWRGGTPGTRIEDGLYAGFGHRTLDLASGLRHDPFVWRLDLRGRRCRLDARVVELPDRWALCDPTCVLERGGRTYLITAQSPLAWFSEQPLRTAVYEFSWHELLGKLDGFVSRFAPSQITI
jgi:hypothetical protein